MSASGATGVGVSGVRGGTSQVRAPLRVRKELRAIGEHAIGVFNAT